MSVSNVKGLAPETAALRKDAVVTGVPATGARRQAFQAKFAAVEKRLTSTNSEPARRSSNRNQTSATQSRSRSTSATVSQSPQMTASKSIDTRGLAQVPRCTPRTLAAIERMRRFKKMTPRALREKIFRLTTDLGLTLLDVWNDTTQQSVTLIVKQSGYSATRFVVEYDDTTWHVAIHADRKCDTDSLITEGEALQERFDAVSLGAVDLAVPR